MAIEEVVETVETPETPGVVEPVVVDSRVAESEAGITEEKETPDVAKTDPVVEAEVATVDAKTEPVVDQTAAEVARLRTLLYQQQKVIGLLRKETENNTQSLADNQLLKTESEEETAANQKAAVERQAQLDQTLELMRLNPTYQDVDTVVSQENFDNLVGALAERYVAERGGDLTSAMTGITSFIWSQTNPYRYTYDLVKQMTTAAPAKEGAKPTPEATKSAVVPVVAPPSLGVLPAGGKGEGGWTAARIDGLDESELSKVPADIYEKYLQGTLT